MSHQGRRTRARSFATGEMADADDESVSAADIRPSRKAGSYRQISQIRTEPVGFRYELSRIWRLMMSR